MFYVETLSSAGRFWCGFHTYFGRDWLLHLNIEDFHVILALFKKETIMKYNRILPILYPEGNFTLYLSDYLSRFAEVALSHNGLARS